MKPLEELSYAELMALFPIALVPHRREWREQYARERERLLLDRGSSVSDLTGMQHGHRGHLGKAHRGHGARSGRRGGV